MKKLYLFIIFVFLFINIFPERYIVKGKQAAIGNAISSFNGKILKKVLGYTVIDIKTKSITKNSMVEKLKQIPGIKAAEIDHIKKVNYIPNDPGYDIQWNLKKIGFEKYSDKNVSDTSVIVAVIDTGIDSSHEDLSTKIAGGHNFVLTTSTGMLYSPTNYDDDNGHGTHCSGIIGAITNNGKGVASVAPECMLLAVKVMDDTGSGYDSDIAQGIKWAADNGAKVLSMSLGGTTTDSILEDACDYAYDKGCVLVAATGNDNKEFIDYPAKYVNVIAVGASDYDDNRASYSNYGKEIDLVAPGGDGQDYTKWILSTYPGGYAFAAGTSMACPHVAGACAILESAGITEPSQIKQVLVYSTDDVGDPGWDNKTGYGRLNIFNALSVLSIQVKEGVSNAYCFPNPFNSYVNVIFKAMRDGGITFTVYNEYMEKLYTQSKNAYKGQNVLLSWSSNDHKNGVYYFLIKTKGGKKLVRGVKVR